MNGNIRPVFRRRETHIWLVTIMGILAVLGSTCVMAAPTDGTTDLDWWNMGMTLMGGLALFLYGMDQMAEALKRVAGDSMKRILARLTTNRLMGLITGAFVTAIIQSSSVTTVMLVGFVTANLMSLSQAIGVILGADIGTTITAQIVAFKVTKYALLLVAIGFLLIFTGKNERINQYGALIMGLGLIFFGMGVMSDGMHPLRTYEPFINLMQNVSRPVIGILLTTFFTGLIQSSSATMGVVIALAMQGLITLEAGIALALGANIGTCITAGLAAIGKPFKVVGVLLIVLFIPSFAELVRSVSPAAEVGLTGMDKLAAETPRQIANAHTIFNIAIAFLFLPAAALFARFCEWVVPDRPLEEVTVIKAKYLDEELISTPSLALDRARLEIGHMGSRVMEMLQNIMPAITNGDRDMLRDIAKIDDEVDILHGHIVTYLGYISRKALTEEQTRVLVNLMAAANDLENIGDIIETDMVHLGNEGIQNGVTISAETREVLRKLHDVVSTTAELAIDAVMERDERAAQEVIAMKGDINRLMDSAALHEAKRLVAEEPNRLAAYTLEIDVIEKLKRIYYFAKRIAKAVMPEATVDHAT
jgi:phosphate:Na+ symporter